MEDFIARVEAKDDTAYDFSEKAESSYRELKMRSSIEGKKYVEALNVKYSDAVLNDLFDEYRYREEVQSKPYEYYKTEVRHAFVTIELSGYRYISPFYTTIDLSTDDLTKIDTSKIPARAKYNGAMVLGEADLSELISKLRVMDVAGAQNTELQNLIVDPIPVENGLLYLEDIKFEVDKKDESVVNKITIDGYCVYN